MAFATIVIPHWLSPKWLQICLASLKATKNERDYEIWIADNSAPHSSIKAIDNRLGEGVRLIDVPDIMKTPALVLDWAIDKVNTSYLFSVETDIRFMKDGWLDWYASFVRDEYVAMVGWYWEIESHDDTRHYIAPAATLYNIEVLKILKAECVANKQLVQSYGLNYEKRIPITATGTVEEMILTGQWGPFTERRGFLNSSPFDRPEVFWHDTGSWLFYRAECQWECARIPGQWVKQQGYSMPDVKLAYYGDSEVDAYIIHYWAGGVSHSFKIGIMQGWSGQCVEWWLRREHRLWLETVPEDIREDSISKGIIPDLEEELKFALSMVREGG
ncbi:hypothetical protein LCGC14_1967930 [marine sediment metagenome]|uniref:Glycosyltransferase 2-like domain-containing protein n=1 Tax=marine sediment metagenome TaxID=412755 RepID=A0A0F9G0T7_9ZZZZ